MCIHWLQGDSLLYKSPILFGVTQCRHFSNKAKVTEIGLAANAKRDYGVILAVRSLFLVIRQHV